MDDIIAYEQNNAAEVLTIHDALSYCIDRIGRVDLSTIAALAKSTREEVLASLSGTIMTQLKAVRHAIDDGMDVPDGVDLADNVVALNTVMPKRVEAKQIKISIGSPWIPPDVYRDFIIALIGIKSS